MRELRFSVICETGATHFLACNASSQTTIIVVPDRVHVSVSCPRRRYCATAVEIGASNHFPGVVRRTDISVVTIEDMTGQVSQEN